MASKSLLPATVLSASGSRGQLEINQALSAFGLPRNVGRIKEEVRIRKWKVRAEHCGSTRQSGASSTEFESPASPFGCVTAPYHSGLLILPSDF
jgi:hypothetical protein